jgi:hypothetical protein
MRDGQARYVRKITFRDMAPGYQVQENRPDEVAFQANPVDAHLSPQWFHKKRYVQGVRAGLYWEAMEKVCTETAPPEEPDSTLTSKYARRLWERDAGMLIALRKWRALGEKPCGRYTWIGCLLENDVVGALESGSKYGKAGRGTCEDISAVLEFLRNRWNGPMGSNGPTGQFWGDESTVFSHAHNGGELTHYSRPGLSSPEHEILRQYRIMRRFQEHETKCRRVLREKFGFEFIEPPARIL